MLDRAVRIGMIGCGTQANVHFAGIKALGADQATVAAVCDLDDERLATACQLWPAARAAKDYRDMLAPGDLDLVIVATMPNTHEAMSLASLDAGACVLCEKPFMMNAAQSEAVLTKAAETRLQVQLGTNMRYMPSSRYLHHLVQGGTIGEPVFAKAWGCHDDPPVWGPHYHLATSGGGVLASTLVHTLDLAMWVGGSPNPLTVSAATRRLFPGKRGPKVDAAIHARYDAEDLISAFVRFDNGTFYSLEGNWCSEVTNFHSFELTTTRATSDRRALCGQGRCRRRDRRSDAPTRRRLLGQKRPHPRRHPHRPTPRRRALGHAERPPATQPAKGRRCLLRIGAYRSRGSIITYTTTTSYHDVFTIICKEIP